MADFADLVLFTAPTEALLTLDEAKDHLRLNGVDDWNGLVQDQVDAALGQLDGYAGRLGRALAPQTWILYLPRFPNAGSASSVLGIIRLPLPPLISVASITYVDTDGATQTLSPSVYQVLDGERAEIRPAYGQVWPATRIDTARAVAIKFQCGYAKAAGEWPSKIQPIRSALKLLVEQEFSGEIQARTDAINRLLRPLTVPRL